MQSYFKILISACVFEAVFNVMIPSGKMKNFALNIINLIVVLILIEPIINLIKTYILN